MSLEALNGDHAALDADEARELVDRIRTHVEIALDAIAEAYARRAWIALGYESWDAMCSAEFGTIALPRDQRRELVADLRSNGMSTRAIAAVAGVDQKTIVNDLRSGEEKSAPVVGLDGKTYPATPTPEVERRMREQLVANAPDLAKQVDAGTLTLHAARAADHDRRRKAIERSRDALAYIDAVINYLTPPRGDDEIPELNAALIKHLGEPLDHDRIVALERASDRLNDLFLQAHDAWNGAWR